MINLKAYAYDIEVLPNFFGIIFINIHDPEDRYVFILSKNTNDIGALVQFITQPGLRLIGYNNWHYDDPVLSAILTANFPVDNAYIYSVSKHLIESSKDETPDWIKQLRWHKRPFESIDLMQLVSVNMSRPSLKGCGIHLKWARIQDFGLDPHVPISEDMIAPLMSYCTNDVLLTRLLYLTIYADIQLREQMSERYGIDIVSAGDSQITNILFEKFYGRIDRKPKKRDILYVKDLLPKRSTYTFKTKVLQDFEADLKTNRLFYPDFKFAHKLVTIGETTYKIGVGGLHSDEKARYFETDDNFIIRDADVTSYYVNFMLTQGVKPEHLGERFNEVLRMLLKERVDGKKAGDPVRRDGLKIPLLNFFGKLNFEPSFLYDPKAAFRVTIGGQVLLLSLIESLELAGIQVISGNTDGVLSKIPRELEQTYFDICHAWEKQTDLELEYTTYAKFAQRDVNNYVAVTDTGKLKVKGIFADGLDVNKRTFVSSFNAPIIALALQRYFKDGIEPEETINAETDIYNFMINQKVGRQYKLIARQLKNGELHEEEMQKTNRWIVGNGGVKLLKKNLTGGRDSSLFKDNTVFFTNDVDNENTAALFAQLNRAYYIEEAWDVIESIKGKKRNQPISMFDLF